MTARSPRTSWPKALAILLTGATILYAFSPFLRHLDMLGRHDWDQMEAHRYLVQKTILRYHQFPFWNPYACGGHAAWGGLESDTVVVSPWLPFYLLLPLVPAIRIEIVGSMVLSAVGAWWLASRFVRSPALKALVTILWVVNVRAALQLSVGHTWHLSYEWTPWAFYFLDRASAKLNARDVSLGAVAFAMMTYTGGIYPVPQTAIAAIVYAFCLAAAARSARPFVALGATGALSLALAAPKLVPLFGVLKRFPRLVDSPETFPLDTLVDALVVRKQQDEAYRWIGSSNEAWHELGMYIGWGVLIWLIWGMLAGVGRRVQAFKWTAVIVFSLALGAFSVHAPWTKLHELPIFRSQHVPTRWLYLALLPAACVAASATELALARYRRVGRVVEVALWMGALHAALGVAPIVRRLASVTFVHEPIDVQESFGPFHTFRALPSSVKYEPGVNNCSSYPAEMLNIATTDCNTFPALANVVRRGPHTPGLGASSSDDPQYRGEVYVDGGGTAEMTRFTPNAIDVTVRDATPGARLFLNQNWDPGWMADGARVPDYADLVTTTVRSSNETIHFRYVPPRWWQSLALAALGLLVVVSSSNRVRASKAWAAGRELIGRVFARALDRAPRDRVS